MGPVIACPSRFVYRHDMRSDAPWIEALGVDHRTVGGYPFPFACASPGADRFRSGPASDPALVDQLLPSKRFAAITRPEPSVRAACAVALDAHGHAQRLALPIRGTDALRTRPVLPGGQTNHEQSDDDGDRQCGEPNPGWPSGSRWRRCIPVPKVRIVRIDLVWSERTDRC